MMTTATKKTEVKLQGKLQRDTTGVYSRQEHRTVYGYTYLAHGTSYAISPIETAAGFHYTCFAPYISTCSTARECAEEIDRTVATGEQEG
jgi:hypothetical protein